MNNEQRSPNPDVNSYDPDIDPGSGEGIEQNHRNENDDIEKSGDNEQIPIPPDSEQPYPVEEPPSGDDAPVGDIDDSPKIIADD